MTAEHRDDSNLPRKRAGRSLQPAVTDAVRDAVLVELAAVGYGKLTMDGVARRARSSKPTLYRRWASKQDMVIDSMGAVSEARVPSADDGRTLLEHVRDLVGGVHEWLSDPVLRRVIPDLQAEGVRSEAMDAALWHKVAEPRRTAMRTMLAVAKERGEVAAEANLELAIDLLGALVYWQVCVLRHDVGDDYLDEVARVVHRELTRAHD